MDTRKRSRYFSSGSLGRQIEFEMNSMHIKRRNTSPEREKWDSSMEFENWVAIWTGGKRLEALLLAKTREYIHVISDAPHLVVDSDVDVGCRTPCRNASRAVHGQGSCAFLRDVAFSKSSWLVERILLFHEPPKKTTSDKTTLAPCVLVVQAEVDE